MSVAWLQAGGSAPGPAQTHWLDAARLRGYSRLILALYLVAFVALALSCTNGIDPFGKPFGYDFITFWSAGLLALNGQAATAFDPVTIFAAQQAALPANESIFLWHYPPMFHAIVAPLGAMPYFVALAVWTAAGVAAFAWVIRRIAPHPLALPLALATGGAFLNLFHGQNAFFNAALFGGAMAALLDRRQVMAGILIGLMVYKPHFGVLVPLAFVIGRQWTAFAAAAVTGAAFVAVSTLIFGPAYWTSFVENLSLTRTVLETGYLPWNKMPTAFATAMIAGADLATAYAFQVVSAVAAAGAVGWLWRRGPTPAACGGLIAAALLVSPYGFDYDLALLSVAGAFMAWQGVRTGVWLPGEREAYLACAVLVPVMPAIADGLSLQIGAFLPLAVLVMAIRRSQRDDHPAAAAA